MSIVLYLMKRLFARRTSVFAANSNDALELEARLCYFYCALYAIVFYAQ